MTTTAARAADVQARIFFLLLRLPPAGVVALGGALPSAGPAASSGRGSGVSLGSGSGSSPWGGSGASPWAGPGGSSPDWPGASPWGGPGPSSWGDPGFSGSAGSMVSPRAQISPSVRQLKRGSVKPQPMPVSPPLSHFSRNNAATASKFQSCQHHADHQSRRSHRTHYPESLPRKQVHVPGVKIRFPALIVPN